MEHIEKISPRVVKLAVASDKKSLRQLHKAIVKTTSLGSGQIYFGTDMEEAKTWLVSE